MRTTPPAARAGEKKAVFRADLHYGIADMRNLAQLLTARLRDALPEADRAMASVQACQDARFGDYQASAAMALAKRDRKNPRETAAELIGRLRVDDLCEKPEIAGAGFINLRLKTEFAAAEISREPLLGGGPVPGSRRVSEEPPAQPKDIVIDSSSPNIAKEMHVGHIRSTILGDSMARIHRFLGNRVVSDNHLGDWGTQFGKLLYGYEHFRDEAAMAADPLAELERLYKKADEIAGADPGVLEACRRELALLQKGDPKRRDLWEMFTRVSWQAFLKIYERLGVRFDEHLGESFYNDMLAGVIEELCREGIAEPSEGALCVFFPGEKDLADKPFLVRKQDGAALYATTDLATLKYRIEKWRPDEIIYVTDGRQQLHFRQLFATAARWLPKASWARKIPLLSHVWFGSILGEDKKPIKTRSGEPIKLSSLLDEAESRALAIVNEKNPDFPEAERRKIARAVGIGAVKYADLAQDRVRDYVFDWSKLLALKGNTAPYLLYALVRIESIQRKAEGESSRAAAGIRLGEKAEIELAKELLRFPEVVQTAADDHRPHHLCFYLYGLAEKFSAFYESCPVLQSEGPVRASRLALCGKAAAVLRQGLYLLGIESLERM